MLSYDIDMVTADAFRIGKLIANHNLMALSAQSLLSALAYSAEDEVAVQSIARDAVSPGWAIAGTVNQLLAGVTKAVFDHPTQYGIVTQKFAAALDKLCPPALTLTPPPP